MSVATKTSSEMPGTYVGLIREFPLRPIRSSADLRKATQIMDRLAVLDRPSKDQADYLEVLTGLIESHEQRSRQIDWPVPDPIVALRFLMNESGMTASDLGRLLGQRQLGAAILRGDRKLSKTHIRILAEHFHVDAGLFL
jgi:HTH-type transcriptional regulator / antitoxin HigA